MEWAAFRGPYCSPSSNQWPHVSNVLVESSALWGPGVWSTSALFMHALRTCSWLWHINILVEVGWCSYTNLGRISTPGGKAGRQWWRKLEWVGILGPSFPALCPGNLHCSFLCSFSVSKLSVPCLKGTEYFLFLRDLNWVRSIFSP